MTKVLIISTNAIGDTYLSMSAIPYLEKYHHNVEISFLITENSRFLFEYNNVQNILVIKKNISEIFKTLININKKNIDYVFSFFPGIVNSFFLKFANAPNKGGYVNYIRRGQWHNKNQKGFIFYNNSRKNVCWLKNENYILRIGKILNQFRFSPKKIEKYKFNINVKIKDNKRLLLHLFSSDSERSLSFEQVKSIINFFSKKHFDKITIVGDEKILFFRDKLPKKVDFIVRPSVKKLVELIVNSLFISVDSFPLHVADAYNSNFIGLFSNTNPQSVLLNSEKSILFNEEELPNVSRNDFEKKIIQYLNRNNT
jgi:ADP-heptose:LPS heptosyltransferase